MTNYQQFALEISKTDTLKDLQRIEGKLVRFYNWQVINEAIFQSNTCKLAFISYTKLNQQREK